MKNISYYFLLVLLSGNFCVNAMKNSPIMVSAEEQQVKKRHRVIQSTTQELNALVSRKKLFVSVEQGKTVSVLIPQPKL